MRNYTREELITLKDFYNNLSVAWFAGGIIGPMFSTIDNSQKYIYNVIGLVIGFSLLKLALNISKSIK